MGGSEEETGWLRGAVKTVPLGRWVTERGRSFNKAAASGLEFQTLPSLLLSLLSMALCGVDGKLFSSSCFCLRHFIRDRSVLPCRTWQEDYGASLHGL